MNPERPDIEILVSLLAYIQCEMTSLACWTRLVATSAT